MNIKDLKIGYVPYSSDLSEPADRRRFPLFAENNKIPYEIADKNKTYDVIVLPAPTNLSKWLIYKKKHPETKFIFEMVDSLIFLSDIFSTFFKGLGRFILGREMLPYLNYKRLIIQWVRAADIVLCSNTELKNSLMRWNKNIEISLDYMESEYKATKSDYSINGKMKLVWEGQGSVLTHFLHFKDLLKQLDPICELHIITSEKYSLYGKLFNRDVSKILTQLPIKTVFHKWELGKMDKIISECDCGIIPLNRKNLFGWHKPANKLISFWFSGIPTLVSNTPAYSELMINANSQFYCSTIDEWVSKLKWIMQLTEEERKEIAMKNLTYA
ncbi:MAG: hypothetical protein ACTHK0_13135, partial [Ginsengibacter sp.]